MQSVNEHILESLVKTLQSHKIAWLVTVLQTWGSSPRPVGSMMCWSELTGTVGSISGGCIEEDVLQQLKDNQLSPDNVTQLVYGGADAERFQLPCGGSLKILIEPIKSSDTALKQWRDCFNYLKARQGYLRTVDINTGAWGFELQQPNDYPLNASAALEDGSFFYYLGPTRQLLIIGANSVARYLAEFATALDYAVTVCDPSPDIAAEWELQTSIRFLSVYPDGFVARDFGDQRSAVVAVSHDPRIDDMALLEALPTQAFYIGAMGSLKTSVARRKRLKDLGLSDDDLNKMKAPIGLDIGSKTPAEIAMSISAHLVQHHGI